MAVILPTPYRIREFPLEMHLTIEPTEDPYDFFVWNRVPLRIGNRRSYRSDFATRLRSQGNQELAYLKIRVKLADPYPIYIQEFFVYSNIIANQAERDELTQGLGKLMMCSTFGFMDQQRWMRRLVADNRPVYLMAGGGQSHEAALALAQTMPWQTCLQFLTHHPNSLVMLLSILMGEQMPEEIIALVKKSKVLPIDVKEQVEEMYQEGMSELEDEDDEDALFAFQADFGYQVSSLFEQEQVELLQDFFLELSRIKSLDIPTRIREQFVIVKDNLLLTKYYMKNYGFLVVDDSSGESIRMETSIERLMEGCQGKKYYQGKHKRRSRSRNRRPIKMKKSSSKRIVLSKSY